MAERGFEQTEEGKGKAAHHVLSLLGNTDVKQLPEEYRTPVVNKMLAAASLPRQCYCPVQGLALCRLPVLALLT